MFRHLFVGLLTVAAALSALICPRLLRAETILLSEWQFTQSAYFSIGSTPPTSITFRYQAHTPFPAEIGGFWHQQIGLNDAGHTFSAPPEFVSPIAQAFTDDNVLFGGSIGPSGNSQVATLSQWLAFPDGAQGHSYHQHVASLRDYRVTELTRTVDSVIIQPAGFGGGYHTGGIQTIRLFGQPIPEPTTAALLCIGTLGSILVARRRSFEPHSPKPGTRNVA